MTVETSTAQLHARTERTGVRQGYQPAIIAVIPILAWLARMVICHQGALLRWNSNAMLPNITFICLFMSLTCLLIRWNSGKHKNVLPPVSRQWLSIGALGALGVLLWPWPSAECFHYVFVASIACMAAWPGGRACWFLLWPSLLILVFSPGVPLQVEQFVVARLQEYGSWVTLQYSRFLLCSEYIREGNVILLPRHISFPSLGVQTAVCVNPECSGYRSLVGMMMLSLVYSVAPSTRNTRFCLVPIAVVVAIAANTVRLWLSTTMVHFNIDTLAAQTPHALMGHFMMVLQIILLVWLSTRWKAVREHAELISRKH
jgi:exosortase/archaeosortase family protein